MTSFDVFLQQAINGLSLGAMYSLLALGFTLVYGIAELINFAHFNVFMVGSMVAMLTLEALGVSGQQTILTGLPLAGVLLAGFATSMLVCGVIGVGIERMLLRPLRAVKGPAAMITTIGVAYVLFNVVLLTLGSDSKNFPNPLPPIAWQIGGGGAADEGGVDLGGVAAADGGADVFRAVQPVGEGDAGDGAGSGGGADDGG